MKEEGSGDDLGEVFASEASHGFLGTTHKLQIASNLD